MSEKKELRFHVRMTVNDLWRFSMYHANRSYMGVFNLLFTVTPIYLLFFQGENLLLPQRFLLVLCACMFSVIQPSMLLLKARRQAMSKSVREPLDITFREEGLLIEQSGEQLKLEWDRVSQVKRIPGELIVYTDRIHAYLLPDRAVDDRKQELTDYLKKYLPKERCKRL